MFKLLPPSYDINPEVQFIMGSLLWVLMHGFDIHIQKCNYGPSIFY